MNDWKEYRLGEVVNILDSKRIPLSTAQRKEMKGQYRYFGAQSVIDYVNDYIFDGDYLILAEDGENLKSRKQPIAQIVSGKFWLNNHAHIMQVNEKADLRVLAALLNMIDVSGYITGSAQPKLNQENMSRIKITLPPLSEQKKIAGILSSFDEKIETNRKINARLEELAQALFKSWFIDFEPFGGKMPEDWKVLSFDDAIEVIAGGTPKTEVKEYWNGDIPWISVKDFVNEKHFVMNTERYISRKGLDNSSTHLLNPGDTIISARGTVGAIAQIQEPMAFNQSCFGLRCKINNGAHWLFYLIHNKVTELKQKSHGSVFDTINRKTLSDLQIVVPTSEILSKFHFIISPIVEKSLFSSKESSRLAKLRDALLPKLMSGELMPE